MKKIKFLFGIHGHQPVGNFEHVFDEAYEKAYLPFLEVMDAHPRVKFSVHYSGILYDWFLEKHPEFIDYLKKLVRRGQVEVMTAGYYEPIIPIIPDEDKIGQINLMNEFIKNHFGSAPSGMWLTERIWEPHLPKILAKVGVEYVTVDDYHFISAGVPLEKLHGYYVTEEEGAVIKVFPIDKNLRYLIPFKLPEETIKYLRELAEKSEGEGVAAILADDAEKFGVWPGTHKWVYQEKYLERLLTLLEENSDWIEFVTFSEFLESTPPLGRIYLPTASYFEMMEWALLTASGKKFEKIYEELEKAGKSEEYKQFIKGGFFRNFFVKYSEANNMHKKMLQVSKRLQTLLQGKTLVGEEEKEKRLKEAQIDLYKGQCNCAYWHGVFGGLYLNYLRHAVYEHLIKAEVELDRYARGRDDYCEIAISDFDKDGNDEVMISNHFLNLYFSPAYGGGLFELDYKPKYFNLINTLMRREEVYHEKIKKAAALAEKPSEGATTIHEIVRVKEKGLENALVYDRYRRIFLLDHFLAEETTLEDFSHASYREVGDFGAEPYDFIPQRRGNEVSVMFYRQGKVKGQPVRVEKVVSLLARQSIVEITYTISNLGVQEVKAWFGTEFNFSLLAGNAPDRYYELEGAEIDDRSLESYGELKEIREIKMVDEWKGFRVSLEVDKPALFWRFPVKTVSQSEGGFERTYQGSVLFPSWKFDLTPENTWQVKIVLRVEE